jgi:kinesin family protein 2/24
MFEHEWKLEEEFDVITARQSAVAIHDARMHSDMRKMFLNHHEFDFDGVFGEGANNDQVYAGTAAPLVREAASGGHSTVMMYGQTGSGKTYTMSAIYERAASDIFVELGPAVARGAVMVTATFVELAGDVCYDMLNEGQKTQLVTGANGEVLPVPVAEVVVSSPADLVAMIDHATSLRATHATGVHDASSRSHAVCRVYIEYSGSGEEGCLTLVDLAGSEHKIDSMWHDADRRKEGAQINASLMALKDCIRARVDGSDKSFSYRKSKLTMLLKTSFASPGSHVVVIATVSPSSKDTEHSLNTLRHACVMDGQKQSAAEKSKYEKCGRVSGGATTTVQLGEVNIGALARERKRQQQERPGSDSGKDRHRAAAGAARDRATAAPGGKGAKGGGGDYSQGQWSQAPVESQFADAQMEKRKAEKRKLVSPRAAVPAAVCRVRSF